MYPWLQPTKRDEKFIIARNITELKRIKQQLEERVFSDAVEASKCVTEIIQYANSISNHVDTIESLHNQYENVNKYFVEKSIAAIRAEHKVHIDQIKKYFFLGTIVWIFYLLIITIYAAII